MDLSSEEEPCATAALRIAVNAAGRVMGISKAGSGGIDPTLTQVGSSRSRTTSCEGASLTARCMQVKNELTRRLLR